MNAILLAAALATADPQVTIRIDVVTTAEGPEVSVEVETHGASVAPRTTVTNASRVSKPQPTEFLYDPYALGCDHPSPVIRTGTFLDRMLGEKPIHEHADGVWHWWRARDRSYQHVRPLFGKVTQVDSGTIPASIKARQ